MPKTKAKKNTAADDRITLRPVTADDREFLLSVYEASREIELAMTPWDAAQKRLFAAHQFDAQTRHYTEVYSCAAHDIIIYNDEPVGRIYVDRGKDIIAIMDIAVLIEHRKKGIATAILKRLQGEAARADRRLTIYVETFNPSQKLFRDLGFEVTGEEGFNLQFEWRAPDTKNSQ